MKINEITPSKHVLTAKLTLFMLITKNFNIHMVKSATCIFIEGCSESRFSYSSRLTTHKERSLLDKESTPQFYRSSKV